MRKALVSVLIFGGALFFISCPENSDIPDDRELGQQEKAPGSSPSPISELKSELDRLAETRGLLEYSELDRMLRDLQGHRERKLAESADTSLLDALIAQTNFIYSRVLRRDGRYDEALRRLMKSELLLQKLFENGTSVDTAWLKGPYFSVARRLVLHSIATIAHALGDPSRAREYYELAIEASDPKSGETAVVYQDLATLSFDEAELIRAGEELRRAKELFGRPGVQPRGRWLGYVGVDFHEGSRLQMMGALEQADQAYVESRRQCLEAIADDSLANHGPFHDYLAGTIANQGKIELERGNLTNAEVAMRESQRISLEISEQDPTLEVRAGLFKIGYLSGSQSADEQGLIQEILELEDDPLLKSEVLAEISWVLSMRGEMDQACELSRLGVAALKPSELFSDRLSARLQLLECFVKAGLREEAMVLRSELKSEFPGIAESQRWDIRKRFVLLETLLAAQATGENEDSVVLQLQSLWEEAESKGHVLWAVEVRLHAIDWLVREKRSERAEELFQGLRAEVPDSLAGFVEDSGARRF